MSVQPIDIADHTSDQPMSETRTRIAVTRDNEFAFHIFHSEHPSLPAPSSSPRPDGMFVTVADVDDLGPWLTRLGGEIHRSPMFEGMSLWTLHTTFPGTRDRRIPLRVSVAVLADELVMADILQAVAR